MRVLDTETGVEKKTGFIDTEWLKESLKTLKAKREVWSDTNILTYMKISYKVEAKTVLAAVWLS